MSHVARVRFRVEMTYLRSRTGRLAILTATGAATALLTGAAVGATFVNNGSIANGSGNPPDGPGLSIMETGETTIGFGVQKVSGNRIADDFVVEAGGWTISGFELFTYQTGSTTTSTITEVNLRIWNGPPDLTPNDTGSTVIFGDTSTNRMVSTDFTGVYRVTPTTLANTTRPIMRVVASAATTLAAGTYWLDVQYDGTLASGPWQVPVALPGGDVAAGNAMQFNNATGEWNNMQDGGTMTQKRMPFKVLGAPDTTIAAATVTGNTAAVTYAGKPTGSGTTFECRLDGAAFAACPSAGRSYADLAAGVHTVQVRAVVGSEVDPSPASQVVTITNPTLALGGKTSQKLGSKVKLTADCDRACTATVSGKLKIVTASGQKLSFKLDSVSVQVSADGTPKVKLKLAKAAKDAAKAALADGGKASAKVKGSAKDSAGNRSAKSKVTVTLT